MSEPIESLFLYLTFYVFNIDLTFSVFLNLFHSILMKHKENLPLQW